MDVQSCTTVCLLLCLLSVSGLRLQPCDSGYVEVVENQAVTLTCDQYSGTAQWSSAWPSSSSTFTPIGTCDATSCTTPVFNAYSLTHNSAGSSTFTSSLTTRATAGARYGCVSSGASESCQLHVVVYAVLSTLNLTVSPPSSGGGWTVSGSVVINKIYSSRGLYTCVWSRKRGNGAYTQLASTLTFTDPSTSSTQDKTGRCDISNSPLPSNAGTYTYRVAVSPGNTEKTDSSVVVATPSAPNITCNPSTYVAENSNLQCTCSGAVGKPSGRLVWFYSNTAVMHGGYGNTSLHMTRTVNITDDGNTLRCDINWVTNVPGPSHTIRVPHGPDGVLITGSSPFDTDGSQTLTLTCRIPQGSTPVPSFTWIRSTGSAVVHQQQTYTFKPQPSEDGIQVTCEARNTVTDVTATDTFTVELNYPPTSDPVITNNSSGGHVYQDDIVTLTCGVTGGKPVNTTSVTFTCPSKSDRQDVVGSRGVSSSVTFNPVTPNDHDKECTCTTRWKQTSWYNKTTSIKLFVNTPPSSPIISVSGSEQYPYISTVTQTATLTCHSTTPGHPAATYTWPQTQGGRPTTDSQGQAALNFTTVSKDLNGKNVSCRASNHYTYNRQSVADGTLTLQVYYHPEVNLVPVTANDPNECDLLTSDTPTCMLNEGQRVHFQCSASSNPSHAEVTWHKASGNNPELLIPKINHTQHTGVYNCSVTTSNNANDPRLPLRGWQALTVLVKYPASIESFTLNSKQQSVTVNVSDTVTLICKANGQPPPAIRMSGTQGEVIYSVPQGTLSLDNEVRQISTDITVRCRDTGVYRCDVSNGVGRAQERNVTVFVPCPPERVTSPAGQPAVLHVEQNSTNVLSFNLWAYPLPTLSGVKILQPDGTFTNKFSNIYFSHQCGQHSVTYAVTCDVTVMRMTSPAAAGFYRVVASNTFGFVNLDFEVVFGDGETGDKSPPPSSTELIFGIVALGITLVMMLLVVAVVVVWLWRRHWTLPCANSSRQTAEPEREVTSPPRSAHRTEQPASEQHYEIQDTTATGVPGMGNNYEHLRLHEMGLKSVYSQISPYDNTGCTVTTSVEDPVYQNSESAKTTPYANLQSDGS